jgi:formiminotetrahydrofolate cyclodeaminase
MPRFADHTVEVFLDILAAPEPTPGGGTAAAVTGAMGIALLMMVAGLNRTRANTDEERAALREIRGALSALRDRLVNLADVDAEAFTQVMTAYRMAKGSDEEKVARGAAVQQALRVATDAPVNVLTAVAEAGRASRTVAVYGNRSAVSDVRVALELLEAAAAGAAANVETNLVGLDDEEYRQRTASTVLDLTNQLVEDAAAARGALGPVST